MIHIEELKMKPCSFGGVAEEPQQSFALASEFREGRIQHGVWQCGPGELDLQFAWSETVYILEGRAEVENVKSKEKFALVPGSMMSFEQGSHWRWRIPWKLKKIFTIIEEEP